MAVMPNESYSSSRLLSIGHRFIRLCMRAGGDLQTYWTVIQDELPNLTRKAMEAQESRIEADSAFDISEQSFRQLNNAVKTAFEKCGQYDREHPAGSLLIKVFPERKFSSIVHAPKSKRPELVRQIANRIRFLEPETCVMQIARYLENAVAAVLQAQSDLFQKLRDHDDAFTRELIARKHFVDQYAATYYNMCRDLGKRQADNLFPNFKCRKISATHTHEREGEELSIAHAA